MRGKYLRLSKKSGYIKTLVRRWQNTMPLWDYTKEYLRINTPRNTAPKHCVKNPTWRRREASRLYIYLFSGHSVSFSSNAFCAVPSKIPFPN